MPKKICKASESQVIHDSLVANHSQCSFVTGFTKGILKGTFCILRDTNLKY